jgi:hypothetical protein
MHSSLVHCEQIFPIEIIVGTFSGRSLAVLGIAEADVAAIETQLDMLDGNVTFPLILGGESRAAAISLEGAGEFTISC